MRNYINKIKKKSGYLLLTVMLINGCLTFAQNTFQKEKIEEYTVSISYDTPFSYPLKSTTSWELKDSGDKLIKKGTGSLENEIFAVPGNYMLQLHEVHNPDSCEHDHIPERLKINVSAMKMVFDFSSVKLSRNITGNQPADGIILSVNVVYSSYDNSTTVYKHGFTTAGVGTSVTGKLKNGEITLKQGLNTLEFVLKGQATKGNYIMIDFVDTNSDVQSYGLTGKIE